MIAFSQVNELTVSLSDLILSNLITEEDTNVSLQDIVERVHALEGTIHLYEVQLEELKEMETAYEDQREKLIELEVTNQQQEEKLAQLDEAYQDQLKELAQLKIISQNQEEKIEDLDESVSEISTGM